jgi:hypothetical protein
LCAIVAALAFSITRSLSVTMLSMLTAAIQPWIVIESRSGWAPILEILGLTAVCFCLSRAKGSRQVWWFLGAGVAIAFSLFAYDTGRLFSGVVAALALVIYLARRPRQYAALAILPPTVLAYAVVGLWSLQNPGALTARFNLISVTFDHPSTLEATRRAVQNYAAYFGVPFLFTQGDHRLLHGTGAAGVLLVTTAPVIFVGLFVALRSWGQPLARFVVLALLIAPIPAALTVDDTPNAPRSAAMMAFFLVFVIFGWSALWPYLARYRLLAAAALAVIAIEATGFLVDLYTQWPNRALVAWSAGQTDAIAEGYHLENGHTLRVSCSLGDPFMFGYFAVKPDPALVQSLSTEAIGMEQQCPSELNSSALPGDILVLAPSDTPPQGAVLLDTKQATVTNQFVDETRANTYTIVLVTVWRR